MNDIFAIGRGQYENVGDIILRRQLLDWVRPVGRLHVYVGDSPPGYDEGLGLQASDISYRSLGAWYRAALTAAVRGGASYVFKPGELQLTIPGLKEHMVMLPLLAAIRLRGGRAVRAGVGARNFAAIPRAMMYPSIALSDLTLWRDVRSAEYMGGEVMPDLAFGEGADDEVLAEAGTGAAGRNKLVVSMRSDEDVHPCPYPTEAWFEAVRTFAARHDLEIWAVTQVRVDDERTGRIAAQLGGRALRWPEHTGHDVQETRLRELYRSTRIALSDRLHVIIAAYTEGAVPVGSMIDGTDKIDRHFRTVGVDGVALRTGEMSAMDMVGRLEAIDQRRAELFAALLEARVRLHTVQTRVQALLTSTPATRVEDAAAVS